MLTRLIAAATLLLPAALPAQTVINSGVPGENSAEVLARTPAVLDANKPSIVVLFVGMNDAANDKKFLAPAQTKSNVEHIVQDIEAAGATTVLVTVHDPDNARLMARHDPKVYGDRSPSQRVADVNEQLAAIAREHNLALAGFHDALRITGGANTANSTDGVHMTAAGYELLAKTVFAALPPGAGSTTIVCLGDSLTYGIGVRAAHSAEEGAETYPAQLRNLLSPHEARNTQRP